MDTSESLKTRDRHLTVLAVIPARAGSKGLPGKCVAPLVGRPLIEHTLRHALAARRVDAICVTTDSAAAAEVARSQGVHVVDRPPEMATDNAPVDAALRHAVEAYESAHPGFRAEVVVLLYANIPIRAPGVIDRAIDHLISSGGDSVRTIAPVGKHHPDWLHRLDGDRLIPFRANLAHRRQDLEPLYYHDGAVVAVTRAALDSSPSGPDDHHAFFGRDRRAILQSAEDAVDVDTALDLRVAEAILAAPRVPPAAPLSIGGRVIDDSATPFIIAEAGVNHDGDVRRAIQLIHAAHEAGADAVKFQAFSADRLVATDTPACDYQRERAEATSQHAMLRRLELSSESWQALVAAARDRGIRIFATPFGIPDVKLLVDLGMPALKLASSDLTNLPLLRAAGASGLPLILSTGAAELNEADAAVAELTQLGARHRTILLHCVSRYPTLPEECNLAAIGALRTRYALPVGFSDHTPEAATGALAVAAGAVVLEKHLTLDRGAAGPDHFFSLTPTLFAEYVRLARAAYRARGDGRIVCTESQREIRRLARGSIVAAVDLPAGSRLSADNLTVRRPGGGIDPLHWDRVVGRSAARPIPAGAPIDWAHLAPAPAATTPLPR